MLESWNCQKQPLEMFCKKRCFWKSAQVFHNHHGSSAKWVFFDNSQNSLEKPVLSLFLIKLKFWGPVTLLKKIPTQVPSCEICKLFKNNYFEQHLWMSASKLLNLFLFLIFLKKETPTKVFSCEFCKLFKNTYFVEYLQTTGSETLVSL